LEERNLKNYKDSDYALNKFSEGIVYRFADRIVEITLEDYLAENPGRTAQDFLELKALSDEIYHEQVTHENRTSRLDVSINGLEETEQLATPSLDSELVHKSDTTKAMEAARRLLDSGKLTEIQRRRFVLHFFQGLSTRQIARMESVEQHSVWMSLYWSAKKLKKFFDE
jgi:DNA-directed RNA polymerase specialized sigma24 family protein